MKTKNTQTKIFPNYGSRAEVLNYLQSDNRLWDCFNRMPKASRELLIGFFLGQNGLPVTYDTVFQKVFDPETHPERLEALLSALFDRKVRILEILPREGTQLTEKVSFVIMDVLVVLDDSSRANLEMQKIGYNFPVERNDCYGADIIMRQYTWLKDKLKDAFSFDQLKKVFCIVIMEQSPKAFKEHSGEYRHHRCMQFDTDIMEGHTGLHEDIFLCLDIFQQNVHNVNKSSSMLDVWLTFLSATDTGSIMNLITEFPEFLPIYQEIAEFATDPEVLITMFSQELYIMDRNMERLMVNELREEVAEKDNIIAEKDSTIAAQNNLISEMQARHQQEIADLRRLIDELQSQPTQTQNP
ncbi:MAG: PD-(D/E)XK nuclease family transposase [Lachnospiraceae bacterium]|nr:PD-(D/E)XK nuclease family transposase [Lachnospiraceae bacterium]